MARHTLPWWPFLLSVANSWKAQLKDLDRASCYNRGSFYVRPRSRNRWGLRKASNALLHPRVAGTCALTPVFHEKESPRHIQTVLRFLVEQRALRALVQNRSRSGAVRQCVQESERRRTRGQGPGHHSSKKVIVAAAGQYASRATRPYRRLGPAQSQRSLP